MHSGSRVLSPFRGKETSYKIHVQQDHNTLKLFDASGLCILVCN